MANDDFYRKLLGLTPDPPIVTLSKLIGLDAPERVLPLPPPRNTSLSTLMGVGAPTLTKFQTPAGIKFLDAMFSEPLILTLASLPHSPGIYAILAFDMSWNPRPYRPVYFGKAADLAARATSSHEKYDEWNRVTQGFLGPYVAFHEMAATEDWQRSALEMQLIRKYSPECNVTHNPFAEYWGGFSKWRSGK